ncbi:hypothetical protein ACFQ0B_04810 [Nonomuraea thailandensis]
MRLRTTGGRRAFVKAVGPEPNAESVRIYRSELRIAAALPESVPAPRLLTGFELDGWVALVFEDVEGGTRRCRGGATSSTGCSRRWRRCRRRSLPPPSTRRPSRRCSAARSGAGASCSTRTPAGSTRGSRVTSASWPSWSRAGQRRRRATAWSTPICGPTTSC